MSMKYEMGRISFQSSEQAARSAYDKLAAARARIEELEESEANLRSQLYQERQDHGNNVKRIKEIAYVMLDTINNERDALQADNERLRDVIQNINEYWNWTDTKTAMYDALSHIDRVSKKALDVTPAQSLARHNNAIREECATAGGPEDSYQDEWFKAKADSAARIRAMMEPE